MQIEIAPNRVDLSDLSAGYIPDPPEASVPMNGSPAMSNLIINPATDALEVRKGFTRLAAGRLTALQGSGYWIRQVFPYDTIDSGMKRYLICILSNGTSNANNVRIYAYDLVNDTFTRIDTAGRTWTHPNYEHWSAIVEGTYYGGVYGDKIYSWHPTDGWNADPTTPSVDTWVDSIAPGAGEKARNYAFKKGTKVIYSSRYYSSLRGIRYKTWENTQGYSRGERVSLKIAEGGQTYWRSFECTKNHTSATATNRPGDGSDWATYWKRVRLKNVVDEDGDDTSDWAYMALPGKSSVGVYHGNRMWVRHDDHDNWSRLQYSAPARPEKGARIADLDWRPTDWAAVDDLNGDGGGWFTVPLQRASHIRGLKSYGNYLLIFGRFEAFALSGLNEQTWTLKRLGDGGVINSQCAAELGGLVYYLADDGYLRVTDGTSCQNAPGSENIARYFHQLKNSLHDPEEDTVVWHPHVFAYKEYLIITFPDETAPVTMFYHPPTGSFYPTNLPILGGTAHAKPSKGEQLYFSAANDGSGSETPCLFYYKDEPSNEDWTDDQKTAGSGSVGTNNIDWSYRTAWLQFGATHSERRLRRVWVKGMFWPADTGTVKVYTDFESGAELTTNSVIFAGDDEGEFVEGKVGQTNTVHAIGIEIVGSASTWASLLGFGVDTEPIRTRYNRNSR